MSKTIELRWADGPVKDREMAKFDLFIQGFEPSENVTIELHEVDKHVDYRDHGDTVIGTITGVVHETKGAVRQFLRKTSATDTVEVGKEGAAATVVSIVVEQPDGGKAYAFSPVSAGEDDELDSWEIRASLKGDATVRSGIWYVARHDRRVPETQATYHWHSGQQVAFYNNGSTDTAGTGGYFADLAKAIDQARHFIFIADWSFQPYMQLNPSSGASIGQRLVDWAKGDSARLVAIHTWDHTFIGAKDSQNDDGEDIFKKEMKKPDNLLWRASNRTGEDGDIGFGWSHHQKWVVLDAPCPWDPKRHILRAFLGGLDLTQGRFDWPNHPVNWDEPGCEPLLNVTNVDRGIHEWYSSEFGADTPIDSTKTHVDIMSDDFHPRQAWHDIHSSVTGPAAWDVVREFVGRWNLDPCWWPFTASGDKNDAAIAKVLNFFKDKLFDKKTFVPQWEPHQGTWHGQILRSITKDHWGSKKPVKTPAAHKKDRIEFLWTIERKKYERSIQDSYLRAIAQAEKFVYIETQFFIGSGKQWTRRDEKRPNVANQIPDALARRILEHASLGRPFHVYILLPMFPEGDPSAHGGAQNQRDFQWRSIEHIVRTVQEGTGDWTKYVTIGYLANWDNLKGDPKTGGDRVERCRKNRRYMIYVHSKMMIVDDRYIILGSANLNERSLKGGRDSEICIALWPDLTKQAECIKQLGDFRKLLWTEHFGALPPDADNPESPANGAWMQALGAANASLLAHGKLEDDAGKKQGHFCTWPIDGSVDGLGIRAKEILVLDGETGFITGDDWYLWPTGSFLESWDLAE